MNNFKTLKNRKVRRDKQNEFLKKYCVPFLFVIIHINEENLMKTDDKVSWELEEKSSLFPLPPLIYFSSRNNVFYLCNS